MLLDAIGALLPAAVAVALSPIPIVAIVVVLGTRRARPNGIAFALGWVAGLTAVSVVVVGLVGTTTDTSAGPSTVVSWARVVLGVLLLWLAVRKWRTRPRGDEEPTMPAWMASVDHMAPPKSLGLGLALSAANPKNLVLTASAAATIAQAQLGAADTVAAVAAFVVIGSCTVAGAVLAAVVAPRRTAGPLESVKTFMSANNAAIMMVILVVFGAKLIGDGVSGLAG